MPRFSELSLAIILKGPESCIHHRVGSATRPVLGSGRIVASLRRSRLAHAGRTKIKSARPLPACAELEERQGGVD